MMIEVAIAVGLIVAIGVFFVVMQGGSSTDHTKSKRELQRNQARETDSSEDDEGPPGSETISQWSDSL